jgi:hypothetical protein
MKRIALVMALFVCGTTAVSAQDAKPVPAFAQPQNEADKPVVAKAQAATEEMVRTLKLDDKQALTVLEINVGMERKAASLANYTGADKQQKLKELEDRKREMFSRYLTPKQFDMYQKNQSASRE